MFGTALQALLLPVYVWRMTGSKQPERIVQAKDTGESPGFASSKSDSHCRRTMPLISGATSSEHALMPMLRRPEETLLMLGVRDCCDRTKISLRCTDSALAMQDLHTCQAAWHGL